MAGIVVWIAIIIWIVNIISKNKKPAGKDGKKVVNRPPVAQPVQSQKNQRPEGEILRRAKASVAEDFRNNGYEEGATGFEARSMGVKPNNSAMKTEKAVYEKPQVNRDRQKEIERKVAEKLAAAEQKEALRAESAEAWLLGQENLLGSIEDLMVKGPNTELPFQRDFLSEGLDMLNQIQV